MVEQWTQGSSQGRGKNMRRFEYRATSPMYVGRETSVYGKFEEGSGEVRLWVVQDGKVGMTAVAHLV
jgi:hydroxyacyl-ACP dehydratase HTD2-like protein with hotdog domain